MCVSRHDHEYILRGVEDFLSFHSIGDDRFFSVGAAIDYIFSVSLCYDYYEYSGGAEAYFIENIESIHMHKRDTEKVKYTKTRLRCNLYKTTPPTCSLCVCGSSMLLLCNLNWVVLKCGKFIIYSHSIFLLPCVVAH